MTHGDAVVHGDGVEFLGHTACRLDFAGHELPKILQVDVTRHELGEAVGDGDDGLGKVIVLHAGGAPQGTSTGHVAASGGGFGAKSGHGATR